MNLQTHKKWFAEWVNEKISSTTLDPEPLRLKLEHTLAVLSRTEQLTRELPDRLKNILALAALYHDFARFDQYLIFQTFKDAQSYNHGFAAVKLLKKYKRLEKLDKDAKNHVMIAVGMHNRAALPDSLQSTYRQGCNIIRDADKLDILRVMENHLSGCRPYNPTIVLSLPDSPAPGNPELVKLVMAGRVGSYSSLRTVNDFRLLLGAWFYDLHSETARRIFISEGYGPKIVADLPQDNHYGPVREKLLAEFAGVGNA